jgi:dihydroflavonol-4-reductase
LVLSASKVLVTGATGFVGRNLVEALKKQGCCITCLVRDSNKSHIIQKAGVHPIIGDLNDKAALRKAVQGIDVVFHIAGAIKASKLRQYLEANQFGTRRLLEAVAEFNPNLSRFVHMSSLSAAGPSNNMHSLTEGEMPKPISWYGESKLRSEQEVLQFSKAIPATILRPSAVYGPRDMETLLIFRMIKRGFMFTPGAPSRRFSLIHVDDLADACIKAAEVNTPSGEIYYISRPEAYEWQDFGNAISRALEKRFVCIPFPPWIALAAGMAGDLWSLSTGRLATVNSQKVKELLQPGWLCDSSKAKSNLGFSPIINLENGVLETSNWYRDHGFL